MSSTYDASHITVLKGLQPVRERPAMYIGSTDTRGLHHLVYEVVDNSIDEALAGFCNQISVSIGTDGSCTVVDNGRGIPVDTMKNGKSALEVVLTVLHAGGKFDKNTYQVSGGLHGVGVSVVNALSKILRATVHRDGRVYEITFSRGTVTEQIHSRKESLDEMKARYVRTYGAEGDWEGIEERGAFLERFGEHLSGTTISFVPDETIFETVTFDYDVLAHRMRELAFLNSGLSISIRDERSGDEDHYCYEGGIAEFVRHLNESAEKIHENIISFDRKDEENRTEVEVAFQYTNTFKEQVYTFVNSVNTREGGTHLEGFRSAITRAINNSAKKGNLLKNGASVRGDDVREGLNAVISIKIANPQFEGQTKTRLGNENVASSASATLSGKVIAPGSSDASDISANIESTATRNTALYTGLQTGLYVSGGPASYASAVQSSDSAETYSQALIKNPLWGSVARQSGRTALEWGSVDEIGSGAIAKESGANALSFAKIQLTTDLLEVGGVIKSSGNMTLATSTEVSGTKKAVAGAIAIGNGVGDMWTDDGYMHNSAGYTGDTEQPINHYSYVSSEDIHGEIVNIAKTAFISQDPSGTASLAKPFSINTQTDPMIAWASTEGWYYQSH